MRFECRMLSLCASSTGPVSCQIASDVSAFLLEIRNDAIAILDKDKLTKKDFK